jgi:hypothetical protein
LAAGRGRTAERGERGVQRHVVDYKGRTGLLPPVAYHTVPCGGTHFLANSKPDTTSALGVRISLEAFKRNPPQPRDLT